MRGTILNKEKVNLSPTQIGVHLHELFRAVIGESYCEFALRLIAFHGHDGSCAIGGVANALADERIRVGFAESRRGARTRATRSLGHRARRGSDAFHAA